MRISCSISVFVVVISGWVNGTLYAQHPVSLPAFHTETRKIDLAPYTLQSPNRIVPDFRLIKGVNGEILVGFQHNHDAVLLRCNATGERIGKAIELKEYWLCAVYPMQDGSLVILASKNVRNDYIADYPNTLYFLTVSAAGEITTNRPLFGGEGHGPGKSWFDGRSKSAQIAFNGTHFGIYFEVQKNWAAAGQPDDIHNGDMFVETDLIGQIIPETTQFWTASHSSTLQIAEGPDQSFYTMTIGDAYPYGLQVYNRNTRESYVAWPPEEDRISYEACNSSTAAGMLKFMDYRNNGLIAVLGTLDHPNLSWDTKVDPLFLKMDVQGHILEKKYLAVTPNSGESTISVNKFGENYLVAFGEGNVYANDWKASTFSWCVVDADGNFVYNPVEVLLPFGTDSELIPVSETTFSWCTGSNGSQVLELHTLELE